jgi:hypothetical protein
MIFAHSLLRRYVAEDVILLLIVSTHVAFDALCSASSHNCWFFQQPAKDHRGAASYLGIALFGRIGQLHEREAGLQANTGILVLERIPPPAKALVSAG